MSLMGAGSLLPVMSTAATRWQNKLAFDCFKPEALHNSSILHAFLCKPGAIPGAGQRRPVKLHNP